MMTTTFDDQSVWQRDPALPFQTMDDEIVVVDPGTRQVHLLNATAARVWTLLGTAQSLPALLDALESEFEATPADLRAEVTALLGEMSDKRLCAAKPAAP